jgi:hypothetical protein
VSTLAGSTHSPTPASYASLESSTAAGHSSAAASVPADAAFAAAEEEAAAHREQQSVPVSLESARFLFPRSVCTSREERHLLLADSGAIRHINTTRKMVGVLSSAVEGAGGMFRDHNGCIWIADTMRHAIKKITPKVQQPRRIADVAALVSRTLCAHCTLSRLLRCFLCVNRASLFTWPARRKAQQAT